MSSTNEKFILPGWKFKLPDWVGVSKTVYIQNGAKSINMLA